MIGRYPDDLQCSQSLENNRKWEILQDLKDQNTFLTLRYGSKVEL